MNYDTYQEYKNLDPNSEEAETMRDGDTFCLIPSSEAPAPAVKGRPAIKSATGFTNLNEALPEEAQLDGTEIYHGVLLGGVVAQLDGEGGGQGTVNPPEVTPTPTPKPRHLVRYYGNKPEGITITADLTQVEVTEGETHFVKEMTYEGESCDFITWKDKATGREYGPGAPLVVTGPVDLEAQWTPVEYRTLTLEIQGNATGTVGTDMMQTSYTLVKGSSYREILVQSFDDWDGIYSSNNAEYLRGWKIVDESGTVLFENWTTDETTPLLLNTNVTATAIWNVTTHTLTYQHGVITEGTLPAPQTFVSGSNVTINASGFGYEVGDRSSDNQYVFKGWELYRDNDRLLGGRIFYNNGTIPSNVTAGDLQLRAVWEKLETATYKFNANGGKFADGSVEKTLELIVGDTLTLSTSMEMPTREHYSYNGWANEAAGTSTATESQTVVSGGKTFYAKWNPDKYRVTYDGNGATGGSMNAERATYGVPFTLTQNAYTRTGFSFIGWRIDSPTSGEIIADKATINVDHVTTLYAQWEEITSQPVTVTLYDTWNAQNVGTVTVTPNGTTITKASVDAAAATAGYSYWVSTADVTITAGATTATMNGERHNYNVSGDVGTKYIVITTLRGLNRIGGIDDTDTVYYDVAVETLTGNYWLMNNISISSSYVWWPLGWTDGADVAFSGKFEGNGNTIGSLNVNDDYASYVGLFAEVKGSVRNLKVTVGSLVGQCMVGGITGTVNEGLIENCYVSGGTIEASNTAQTGRAGGIAGENYGTIRNCVSNLSSIDAINFGGGITGANLGLVDQCYSTSGGNNTYAYDVNYGYLGLYHNGGIAGGNRGTISNCYVYPTREICATQRAGGLVGTNFSDGTVTNCWVNHNNKVWGGADSGIFIGYQQGVVSSSYVISTTSGSQGGATRITATNFKGYTSISGWDSTIWDFGTTSQYPALKNISIIPFANQPRS